jgi:HlyD family secretion protein
MKRFFFWIIVIGVVIGGSAAGYSKFHGPKQAASETYRTAKVRRGEIKSVVNSSGTVQPVQSVQVGAFVPGPITTVNVNFNDEVKADQILALVDKLIPKAQFDQAQAALSCAKANLLQAEAKAKQAERDWKRAQTLLPEKAISDTDYDMAEANRDAAKATVASCKATIEQNTGALEMARSNLKYTEIKSPVDGVITDRKVDSGQTVATQFQTPVLFVVAPELYKRVYVQASVDEADIGMIREAQLRGEPVTFTVDAYPKDTFSGKIPPKIGIRLTPTTVQNVVTYTVVVEAPNLERKLLPGMTANLSFQIEKRTNVLKVPNAALRFFPKPNEVRKCDLPILEGNSPDKKEDLDAEATDEDPASKEKKRKERYVWVIDGDVLAVVKITTGLSDKSSTEVVAGDLKDGQEVVTGMHLQQ